MYKAVLILFCVALFAGCGKKDPSDCGTMICTNEFRSVLISFTDKDGKSAAVKNYSALNQRTGETLKPSGSAVIDLSEGTFNVVDDSSREKLSAEGDDIKVSATSEATGQTKSVVLKVAGGKCSCHIQKISGPEQVAFD